MSLLCIVLVVAAFVFGILFGRKNSNKADKLAAEAKKLKEQMEEITRKKG